MHGGRDLPVGPFREGADGVSAGAREGPAGAPGEPREVSVRSPSGIREVSDGTWSNARACVRIWR